MPNGKKEQKLNMGAKYMCQLPRTQPESVALTNRMIAGFSQHPATFPSADIPKLQDSLNSFYQARESFADAQAIFKQAGQKQKQAFEQLKKAISNQIKAAQVDTADEPVKLGLIGSGPRRKKSALNLPIQPQLLDAKALAAGVVRLAWKKTFKSNCGPVRSFIIESRTMNNGETTGWGIAGTSLNGGATLKDQPQGVKTEYRVTAVNHSGKSFPSNTVSVVL